MFEKILIAHGVVPKKKQVIDPNPGVPGLAVD